MHVDVGICTYVRGWSLELGSLGQYALHDLDTFNCATIGATPMSVDSECTLGHHKSQKCSGQDWQQNLLQLFFEHALLVCLVVFRNESPALCQFETLVL